MKRCKEAVWSRWRNEYLKGLRERHKIVKGAELKLQIGDVVIIKDDERNRAKWKLGIINNLIQGRDGVVRGVKLRAGRSFMERAVQHIYPLELQCDRSEERQVIKEKDEDTRRSKRSKRNAATVANIRIQDQAEYYGGP